MVCLVMNMLYMAVHFRRTLHPSVKIKEIRGPNQEPYLHLANTTRVTCFAQAISSSRLALSCMRLWLLWSSKDRRLSLSGGLQVLGKLCLLELLMSLELLSLLLLQLLLDTLT